MIPLAQNKGLIAGIQQNAVDIWSNGNCLLCRFLTSETSPGFIYLKFDAQMSTIHVEDMSWMRTSRKKLPPVRAHPVYYSLSRPSPPGAPLRSAALTGSGAWSPARTEGTRSGAAADG
jgi:hypothetical protein